MSLVASAASASAASALTFRSRVASSSTVTAKAAPKFSYRAGRRSLSLAVRAEGQGDTTSGFPYLIARAAGFDTSEGIVGFTPFAELWVGRTAMGGFATGLVQELATGDGILAQLGWETPNDNIFNFLVLFLGGSSIAGTIVTLKQLTSGDMSMAQFQRYKNFFGLSAEDDAKKVAGEMKYGEDEQVKPSEGAAADAVMASMSSMDEPELSPKQVEKQQFDYMKSVELSNARAAMVGFAAAILMEAKIGGGMIPQLILYGKMSGLLGPDSGF